VSPLTRLCGVCEADVRRGLELDGALGASAGVDAGGFVEDLPASFRCVLFEELVARGEVEAAVLAALERASDDEEAPPP
jgi:hypothetical protein